MQEEVGERGVYANYKALQPDLMICFTGALSHKVLRCAQNEIKGLDTKVEHSRTASVAALRNILEKHTQISA